MKDDVQVPEWKLERYLLGELAPPEMEDVRKAAQSDGAVARRLEELRQSNGEILRKYPPESIVRQVHGRAYTARSVRPKPGSGHHFGMLPRAAALIVVLLFVLLPIYQRLEQRPPQGTEPETRMKGGGPSLLLYRKVPSGSERLDEGSLAHKGDMIQIAYQGSDHGFGVIVSLDGRGVVTLHLPERGSQSARLETGRLVPLESAFELDDAPRWECFYFITAAQPFPVDLILQAAHKLNAAETPPDRLPISDSFTQAAFVLRKASGP